MLRRFIARSLGIPHTFTLCVAALVSVGICSFLNINVKPYPDSASAITDVVAEYSEKAAEEDERQVTNSGDGRPGI